MQDMTPKQVLRIAEIALEKGLTKDGMTILEQGGFLADLFEAAGKGGLISVSNRKRDTLRELLGLPLLNRWMTINYDQPLTAAIAAGHYDSHDSDITAEHFPPLGVGRAELTPKLFHFGRVMSTDKVLEVLAKGNKHRATNLRELLVFGETFPEDQSMFPIVALGQSARIDDDMCVPYLYANGPKRRLGLSLAEIDSWEEDCRFLVLEL